MIYRITFTHGPDYEFVLASVKSMARLRAWNQIGAVFLLVDPTRSFTTEQCNELRKYKCIIYPTPIMTGPFTGVTFNWSWEGIAVQLLAYKWVLMNVGLNRGDYIMRADSDTVFTSSRFLTYTTYDGEYHGKGNDRTWILPDGSFRPTEGPCVLIRADTFFSLAGMRSPQLAQVEASWPDLPLVDDVFYSYFVSRSKEVNPIKYYESNEWYTGTTVEEFQAYLNNGQSPGAGFLFHWLGHLRHPVKDMLANVVWAPES